MEAIEKKVRGSNLDSENKEIFNNVLVRIPRLTNNNMTWINAHEIEIEDKNIFVEEHYRCGIKFGNDFVTINYYNIGQRVGETAVVGVTVIRGINKKTGNPRFILDISPAKEGNHPEFQLKVGSPNGEKELLIPGTEADKKYIKFQEI